MMDAYLSKEAYHSLVGLNNISPNPNIDGLLIGHKRGHRFFIEKILPTKKGFYSSFENYLATDKHFGGKLIGFFTFQLDEKKMKKIFLPFAYGKLFLDIKPTKEKMQIKSYIIDYEKDFFLSPVELTHPKP